MGSKVVHGRGAWGPPLRPKALWVDRWLEERLSVEDGASFVFKELEKQEISRLSTCEDPYPTQVSQYVRMSPRSQFKKCGIVDAETTSVPFIMISPGDMWGKVISEFESLWNRDSAATSVSLTQDPVFDPSLGVCIHVGDKLHTPQVGIIPRLHGHLGERHYLSVGTGGGGYTNRVPIKV